MANGPVPDLARLVVSFAAEQVNPAAEVGFQFFQITGINGRSHGRKAYYGISMGSKPQSACVFVYAWITAHPETILPRRAAV